MAKGRPRNASEVEVAVEVVTMPRMVPKMGLDRVGRGAAAQLVLDLVRCRVTATKILKIIVWNQKN